MNARKVGYWVTTAIIAFFMGFGGAIDVARPAEAVAAMQKLGYAPHFMVIIGVWKVLGAVAVLIPGTPRLKEWAYAGMIFDLTGAAASHAAVGDPASSVILPLLLCLVTAASWALRPESRVLRGETRSAAAEPAPAVTPSLAT